MTYDPYRFHFDLHFYSQAGPNYDGSDTNEWSIINGTKCFSLCGALPSIQDVSS